MIHPTKTNTFIKRKDLQIFRERSLQEIAREAAGIKKKLSEVRFELASGKGKNLREVRRLKTTLAQLLTLIQEKEAAGQKE